MCGLPSGFFALLRHHSNYEHWPSAHTEKYGPIWQTIARRGQSLRLTHPISRRFWRLSGCTTLDVCSSSFHVLILLWEMTPFPRWSSHALRTHARTGQLTTMNQGALSCAVMAEVLGRVAPYPSRAIPSSPPFPSPRSFHLVWVSSFSSRRGWPSTRS